MLALVNGLVSVLANSCNSADSRFDTACYSSSDIITREVAVVGGGSSGTYGAIKLSDMGRSAVVIEKESLLGGHVNTYTDPENGVKIDYGVIVFANNSVVIDFFARFGISLVPLSVPSGGTTVYADFKTGRQLSNFTPDANLSPYTTLLDSYPDLSYNWTTLPSPVPQDLLLNFSDFVEKFCLQDFAFSIYSSAATGGLGNILQQLTLSVFKAANRVATQGAKVETANHDNHQIYDLALAELGSNVLLNSTVIAAQRPTNSF
ncbi:MAG: hypothetical protein MMC33_003588 [Icmadophila ericetorum]|nr:hypothetical protein [Icmadophila ericetorum]